MQRPRSERDNEHSRDFSFDELCQGNQRTDAVKEMGSESMYGMNRAARR